MPYYCRGFLNILRPTNNILPYYLHCVLCSSTIKNNISIIANGNNINNLSSKLKYLRVPVPQDVSIQQKIIDEFKKLELDKEKYLSSINEFKQSILLDLEKNKTPNNQKLNKYMQLEYGKALPEREREQGNFPVVGSSGIVGYHNDYMIMGPNIIVGRKGSVGKVYYIEENCTPIDTTFYIKINKDKIRLKYAYYILESLNLGNLNSGLGPGGVNRKTIHNKLISVPDLDIQDQFIKKIEVYEKQIEELQKEIDEIPAKKQAILE